MAFEAAKDRVAVRDQIAGQAEHFLGSMLRSLDYGVLLVDLNHVSLACNQAFGEQFGVPIDEIVSTDPQTERLFMKDRIVDFEAWTRNLDEVHNDYELVQIDDFHLVNPTKVFRRYTGPVRDDTGAVIARLWTFQDRTEEWRLQRMRDCLHETSLVFDPDPRVVYDEITRSVAAFYGSVSVLSIRHDDYMEFRSIAGVPPGFDVPGNPLVDSYCQLCVEDNAPIVIQDAKQHPALAGLPPALHGMTRYAGVPLRNPEDQIIGTFCIMDGRSDEALDDEDVRFLSLQAMRVSSELERERQLSSLARDLEETQSSLIRSEKLAITGTLAASVAHDIRNILSAISLTISMGQDDPKHTLGELRGHLDRFQILSHKLLSYARPHKVIRRPVDIPELFDRVADLLKSYFKVSGVQVVQRVEEGLPPVSSDPGHLDHVFVNLLMNGIQVSQKGQRIHLGAERCGSMVRVTVRDEGGGIPEAALSGLFEPFATTRTDGMGLGLYSCKQIVRDSGGRISVSSTPGQGATFTIDLPAWKGVV